MAAPLCRLTVAIAPAPSSPRIAMPKEAPMPGETDGELPTRLGASRQRGPLPEMRLARWHRSPRVGKLLRRIRGLPLPLHPLPERLVGRRSGRMTHDPDIAAVAAGLSEAQRRALPKARLLQFRWVKGWGGPFFLKTRGANFAAVWLGPF